MKLEHNFKCKTCGLPLDELVTLSTTGLVECSSCFNVWTIPKKEASPEALHFLRMGEHDLDIGQFDNALAAYKKAAELDPQEPEAYFGMALAEFKIRYLKDHVNNRMQPICYEITAKRFLESESYHLAVKHATQEQRAEYEKRGKDIDYILNEFLELSEAGKDYDCFICVKVTDPVTHEDTKDSKAADYIYRLLQEKGYKPFYSERELHNVTGADYEARIMYALYMSECMLVVCNNEEYLQTPWVKNEYSRFLKLMNDAEKESDSITLVFDGTPIEKLPGRAGKIQGINYALREADGKIVDFVASHTPESRRRREEEKKRREEQEQVILQQIEQQKKQQRELEDKLKNLQGGQGMHATSSSLLTRGYQELAIDNVEGAEGFFDRVLEAEPKNGGAWWGKMLIEIGISDDDQLNEKTKINTFVKIAQSRNYLNALQYAGGDFQEHLDKVCIRIQNTASARKDELERRKKRASQSIKEEYAKHSRRAEELQRVVNNAQENANLAYANLPKNKPADSFNTKKRLARIRTTGLAIAISVVFVLFILFVALPHFPESFLEKLEPIWELVTWGISPSTFFNSLFRALVYGGSLSILVMLIMLIVFFVKRSKYNKLAAIYRAAEDEVLVCQYELKEAKERLNREKARYQDIENELNRQIKDYNKAINVYNKFIG